MAGPDYIVDIEGLEPVKRQEGTAADGSGAAGVGGGAGFGGRPWLAVMWRCCSVYSRIYRNRKGDAYEGRCPRCARRVRVGIGPGGTSSRFFEAE